MIRTMLIAGLGGLIGTCLRFLVGKVSTALFVGSSWPWGTFIVNIVGSFIIGVLFGLVEKGGVISPRMNAFLITGFCGGFTTFSSLSHDMLSLLESRHFWGFGAYAVGSFALGLLFVWVGRLIIKGA